MFCHRQATFIRAYARQSVINVVHATNTHTYTKRKQRGGFTCSNDDDDNAKRTRMQREWGKNARMRSAFVSSATICLRHHHRRHHHLPSPIHARIYTQKCMWYVLCIPTEHKHAQQKKSWWSEKLRLHFSVSVIRFVRAQKKVCAIFLRCLVEKLNQMVFTGFFEKKHNSI